MQKLSIILAAAALFVATSAFADGPNTGRNWDDSHMRTRFAIVPVAKERPAIILGDATTQTAIPDTLDATTWHSWGADGQSIRFGKQEPRRLNGGSLSFSSIPTRGSGSGSGSGSLGRSSGRGLR